MPRRPTLAITLLLMTVPLASTGLAVDDPSTSGHALDTLDWTDRFLEVNAADHEDALTRSVALAQLGTVRQAPSVDMVPPELIALEGYQTPSQALLALTDRLGVEPTVEQLEEIQTLDDLEPRVASALAGFVDAFLVFDQAVQATNSGDWHPATDRPGPDPGLALAARSQLLDVTVELRDALDRIPSQSTSACSPVHVPPAFTIDLDACDSTYTDAVVLQLDAGGQDVYENNAGGNSVTFEGNHCDDDNHFPVAALADLGGKDDAYRAAYDAGDCGRLGGAAAGGAGFLLDDGGHDSYDGEQGSYGALNGGGLGTSPFFIIFGQPPLVSLGFLLDAAGNDQYLGLDGNAFRFQAVNGAGGQLGYGFLLDGEGDDLYRVENSPANGGTTSHGSGFLLDAGGDDVYDAGSEDSYVNGGTVGLTPPFPSTGAGMLLDLDGVDTYRDGIVEGGECVDCSVVPKGHVGAQVDV